MARRAAPASPLEAHLGYWLRFVSNHVSQAFSRKLEAEGVSVAEWVMLRELLGGPLPPSRIAGRLGMTRGAISKLSDRLAARGLVSQDDAGGDDRRYQSLALTPAGRSLVPRLAALADRNDDEFFGHLPAAERARLVTAMRGLVSHHGLHSIPTT